MTEDEAKTKWCPFARVSMSTDKLASPGHNRSIIGIGGKMEVFTSPNYARCIASACIAWREPHPTNGYCGLAGAPR